MCIPAIRNYLSSDTISTTSSSVSAANSDVWPTSASVADYAYKSLGELWLLTSTPASSDLAKRIVHKFGEGRVAAEGEISLYLAPLEGSTADIGVRSQELGSEASFLEIVFRLPEASADWDRIINAELRVRYLLDSLWRGRRKMPPSIPSTGDKSLNGNIFCQWDRYMSPPNANEVWVRYYLSFTRIVPR
jgi:hypothetical protein